MNDDSPESTSRSDVEPVRRLVVMGVAGSGKTTLGERVADHLGSCFVDADAAHPQANIDKMAAGIPLTDADRRPWLRTLRDRLARSESIVVTCSALRRSYRDVLREACDVTFVYLDIDHATAAERLGTREGHFMRAGMVASQFDALERPGRDETDVLAIDARLPADAVFGLVAVGLGS